MTPSKVIRIAPGRSEQLEELRQLTGAATYSEIIGQLIDIARAIYPLRREVPGVMVNRIPAGVQIFFDGRAACGLTVEGTRALAAAIRQLLAHGTPTADKANGFDVRRRGSSIAVSIPAESDPAVFVNELAMRLSDLLERTANSAHSAA